MWCKMSQVEYITGSGSFQGILHFLTAKKKKKIETLTPSQINLIQFKLKAEFFKAFIEV